MNTRTHLPSVHLVRIVLPWQMGCDPESLHRCWCWCCFDNCCFHCCSCRSCWIYCNIFDALIFHRSGTVATPIWIIIPYASVVALTTTTVVEVAVEVVAAVELVRLVETWWVWPSLCSEVDGRQVSWLMAIGFLSSLASKLKSRASTSLVVNLAVCVVMGTTTGAT